MCQSMSPRSWPHQLWRGINQLVCESRHPSREAGRRLRDVSCVCPSRTNGTMPYHCWDQHLTCQIGQISNFPRSLAVAWWRPLLWAAMLRMRASLEEKSDCRCHERRMWGRCECALGRDTTQASSNHQNMPCGFSGHGVKMPSPSEPFSLAKAKQSTRHHDTDTNMVIGPGYCGPAPH